MVQRPASTRLPYFHDVPGTTPGTLQIAPSATSSQLDLIDYNPDTVMQLSLATPQDCAPYLDTTSVSWINVRGLGNGRSARYLTCIPWC